MAAILCTRNPNGVVSIMIKQTEDKTYRYLRPELHEGVRVKVDVCENCDMVKFPLIDLEIWTNVRM